MSDMSFVVVYMYPEKKLMSFLKNFLRERRIESKKTRACMHHVPLELYRKRQFMDLNLEFQLRVLEDLFKKLSIML